MKDKLEILFWKAAILILRRGYGANCRTSDVDDFPEMLNKNGSKYVESNGRCGSCRAKETIKFIKDHIELIKL